MPSEAAPAAERTSWSMDLAVDEVRRLEAFYDAGYDPDLLGEMEAERRLYEGLDPAQAALLADMQTWTHD